MVKYLAILLNGILFSFLGFFLDNDISVETNLPETYIAGEEFEVAITINKKDISGFARVEVELQPGLIPTNVDSKGGAFSYKEAENKVKIIWFNLPPEESFTIKYKVAVSPDFKGDIKFNGRFLYVEQPAGKKEHAFEEKVIKSSDDSSEPIATTTTTESVTTEPTATNEPVENTDPDPSTIATNNNANTASTTTTPPATTEPITITVNRSIDKSNIKAGEELLVTVKINKGNMTDYSRFLDVVPEGFTAMENESYGGKFSFNNNEVKILWLSLPSEPEFSISYKLISATSSAGSFELAEGLFFYASKTEGTPKKVNIESKSFSVEGTDNSNPDPDPVTEVTPDPTPDPDPIPTPETGVSYKVQICATHQKVTSDYFVKNNNVSEPINMEMHEGWTKFTVGNFNVYKDARDHRETVRTSYKIVGPFVTAYNSGTRITVQEALRLTNQTWYQ